MFGPDSGPRAARRVPSLLLVPPPLNIIFPPIFWGVEAFVHYSMQIEGDVSPFVDTCVSGLCRNDAVVVKTYLTSSYYFTVYTHNKFSLKKCGHKNFCSKKQDRNNIINQKNLPLPDFLFGNCKYKRKMAINQSIKFYQDWLPEVVNNSISSKMGGGSIYSWEHTKRRE